jgi:hypothetical protein
MPDLKIEKKDSPRYVIKRAYQPRQCIRASDAGVLRILAPKKRQHVDAEKIGDA